MTQYTSSLDYLMRKEFLTIIIPLSGEPIIDLMSTPKMHEHVRVLEDYKYRSNGVVCLADDDDINDSSISFCCGENYRTSKDIATKTNTNSNIRATMIANFLDEHCNHNIIGSCAFIFDNDNNTSRFILAEIQKILINIDKLKSNK